MRILFYSLNYAPELTATGKYTGEMAAWFAMRGHQVDAIAGMPHYPQWSLYPDYLSAAHGKEMLEGVSVMRIPHYIPHRSAVSVTSRIRMDLSFIFRSFRRWWKVMTQRDRYDVVVLICPPMFTSIYPVVYKLLRGVPWVLHMQDIQLDVAIQLGLIRNVMLKRLLSWVEVRLLKSASSVSTISKSMRSRLAARIGSDANILLTPNWANPDVFVDVADNTFRRDHAIPQQKTLVMYSGNLGRKQGVEILLDVIEKLQGNPEIHFAVIGEGAARDELVSAAGPQHQACLTFLPVQPAALLPAMLQAADIHLVIQRQETSECVLPSKLTNIMASGRPCIVTANEGAELGSIVAKNRAGIQVDPGDAAQLADAIAVLHRESSLAAEYGRNARQFARNHLEMDVILSAFEQRLQRLTEL